jgi:hypothetical protein
MPTSNAVEYDGRVHAAELARLNALLHLRFPASSEPYMNSNGDGRAIRCSSRLTLSSKERTCMWSNLSSGQVRVNLSLTHPTSFKVTPEHGSPVVAIDGLRLLIFRIGSGVSRYLPAVRGTNSPKQVSMWIACELSRHDAPSV